MKIYIFFYLLILLLFFSCEQEVNLDLNSYSNQIVVEGYIQEGYPAYVFLTSSEHYFNVIDTNTLNNLIISDARVVVERDDGLIHELTYIGSNFLDSLDISDTINVPTKALYLDLSYLENNFSQTGHKYKLNIEWRNKVISSTTIIPPKYPIDSIWVKRKEPDNNHKCYIWGQMNDPDTLGNSILAHYKRDLGWKPIDPIYVPCAIIARTDNIINGQNFSTYFSRSGTVQNDDGVFLPFDAERLVDGKLVQEDIVILRIAHVDINTYNFFRSTYLMQNSNNNPFAEPMNLSSNVNGGLGIWAGLGVSYYYIPIVPDTVIKDSYNNNFQEIKIHEIF